jgi:hypothetical protein
VKTIQQALREAIATVKAHSSDYDHVTSEADIARWEEILAKVQHTAVGQGEVKRLADTVKRLSAVGAAHLSVKQHKELHAAIDALATRQPAVAAAIETLMDQSALDAGDEGTMPHSARSEAALDIALSQPGAAERFCESLAAAIIAEGRDTPVRRARKVGGSYQANGTVVATFQTLGGKTRHVFEFDEPAGMLHIFGPEQVEFCDGGVR